MVSRLRVRRMGYAFAARRGRIVRGFGLPMVIVLPRGSRSRWERRIYLFWRIRLALWVILGVLGGVAAGLAGVLAGVVIALMIEVVVSYRPAGRFAHPQGRGGPGRGSDGDPSGDREPRRPRPQSGAGSAMARPESG